MKRYDLILFCREEDDPDSIAQMYEYETGKYVKYEDALDTIGFLIDALRNLRDCNVKMNTPAELNQYVNAVLNEIDEVAK